MQLNLRVISCENIPHPEELRAIDPYISFKLSFDPKIKSTRVIDDTLNPVWNSDFEITVDPTSNSLSFGLDIYLFNHDPFDDDFLIGSVSEIIENLQIFEIKSLSFELNLADLTQNPKIPRLIKSTDDNGVPLKTIVKIQLQFSPISHPPFQPPGAPPRVFEDEPIYIEGGPVISILNQPEFYVGFGNYYRSTGQIAKYSGKQFSPYQYSQINQRRNKPYSPLINSFTPDIFSQGNSLPPTNQTRNSKPQSNGIEKYFERIHQTFDLPGYEMNSKSQDKYPIKNKMPESLSDTLNKIIQKHNEQNDEPEIEEDDFEDDFQFNFNFQDDYDDGEEDTDYESTDVVEITDSQTKPKQAAKFVYKPKFIDFPIKNKPAELPKAVNERTPLRPPNKPLTRKLNPPLYKSSTAKVGKSTKATTANVPNQDKPLYTATTLNSGNSVKATTTSVPNLDQPLYRATTNVPNPDQPLYRTTQSAKNKSSPGNFEFVINNPPNENLGGDVSSNSRPISYRSVQHIRKSAMNHGPVHPEPPMPINSESVKDGNTTAMKVNNNPTMTFNYKKSNASNQPPNVQFTSGNT